MFSFVVAKSLNFLSGGGRTKNVSGFAARGGRKKAPNFYLILPLPPVKEIS